LKSALFVDFDNIYSGLRQLDQSAADRFARSPMDWVNWMVSSLALPEHVAGDAKRRVLVRRCYLNPQAYQRFRPFFNLAGFEIIDCPALTSGGKTSTDINMVLDIIDLLQHETHYDEFILFSADADFTPVLRKLRRWDRRTTVLAIGFPSAAYRASADLVIDQDEFIRGALGMAWGEEVGADVTTEVDAIKAVLGSVSSAVAHESSNAVVGRKANVRKLAELVRSEVKQSPDPVPCARIASVLSQRAGMTTDWYGHGSFRRLLESLDLGSLVLDWKTQGGLAYDPTRHNPAGSESVQPLEQDWAGDAASLSVARQIHEVTGVPLLSPYRYQILFVEVANDVAESGYDFLETAKRVRDRCRERGQPISRADITFVLRGIVFRGHRFDEGPNTAVELAQKFLNNVRSLCLREQILLDASTESAIRRWIGEEKAPTSPLPVTA
jgi:hypothetical protein